MYRSSQNPADTMHGSCDPIMKYMNSMIRVRGVPPRDVHSERRNETKIEKIKHYISPIMGNTVLAQTLS